MRTLLLELRDEWAKLEEQIDTANREFAEVAKKDDGCRRLLTIPGIGPLTATALIAAIGNGCHRQLKIPHFGAFEYSPV